MSETSTTRACLDCDTPLTAKATGAPPLRCPTCAKAKTRASAREYQRRRRAGLGLLEAPETECVDCEASITRKRQGGRPTTRCDVCQKQSLRDGVQRWRKANGRYRNGDVITVTCMPCLKPIEWTVVTGRRPWMCDECKALSYRASAPQRRQQAHVRRALIYGAGYELFDVSDVYERDRWICGICRRKIDRRLMWPNRLCVTLDHVIPVSQGGPHSKANTRPAHYSCNSSRKDGGGNEQLALLG